jgi:hypothetical protein
MRIFKTRVFNRFARRSGLDDRLLATAVDDVSRGLVDADLGGGVLKQRVARPGGGKSGGFRTIIVFRIGDHAFFVYGYAKNERANIRNDELVEFRRLASILFAYGDDAISAAIAAGELFEVNS